MIKVSYHFTTNSVNVFKFSYIYQLCFYNGGINDKISKCKRSSKHTKMATMRLYHRRASASRERLDRLHVPNGNCFVNSLRSQSFGPCGQRESPGVSRPRSQSLFPGSDHMLVVPPRSRSHSFSGASKGNEISLTASEEEHIFQCYTRIMYILLGGLAAGAMGLVLYGVHSFAKFQ